jgi:hypothetical protein
VRLSHRRVAKPDQGTLNLHKHLQGGIRVYT